MDSAYAKLGDLPFGVALTMLATVISINARRRVGRGGQRPQGAGHGPRRSRRRLRGRVRAGLVPSDEHLTFAPAEPGSLTVGERVRYVPAHVDPTIAYHEQLWLVDGDEVLERWPVDLRGW